MSALIATPIALPRRAPLPDLPGYMLLQLEEMMIRFHMGLYGANEFEQYCGEYSLCGDHSNDKEKMTREEKEASKAARYGQSLRNAWYHNPIVKVMYFCDELATLEEKAKGD